MIDEQYYQLAAEELDTTDLKTEIWDRACKLASDDPEEAQLLYINLRVEEMLADDNGPEHAFTSDHASNDPMISSVDKLDAMTFEDDGEEFDISDQIEAAEATDYDEVLAYDEAADVIDTDIADTGIAAAGESSFSDMSGVEVLSADDIPDFEKAVNLSDAAEDREYTAVMDSDITGDSLALAPEGENIVEAKVKSTDTTDDAIESSDDAFNSPEAQKTALLTEDFERQAMDMGEIELDQDFNSANADEATDGPTVTSDNLPYSESFNDALQSEENVSVAEPLNDSFDSLSGASETDEVDQAFETNAADMENAADESIVPTSAYEDTNYDPLDDLLNNLSNHAYNDLENNEVSVDNQLAASTDDASDSATEFNNDSMSEAPQPVAAETTADSAFQDELREANEIPVDADNVGGGMIHTPGIPIAKETGASVATTDATAIVANASANHSEAHANDVLDINADVDTVIEANESAANGAFMVFSRDGEHEVVKQGTSLPALLITFPWLLKKTLFGTALTYAGLWLVSLGGLLAGSTLWMNATNVAPLSTKLFTAAFALLAIIGLLYLPYRFGNSWVAEKLQNKGFEFKQAIEASSKKDVLEELQNQAG